jgi:hypothetical protein
MAFFNCCQTIKKPYRSYLCKKKPEPNGDLTPYLTYVYQSLCKYLTHELSQLVPILSRSLTAQSPEGLQK